MHFTCKKGTPPPAKADCVSASGKTRPKKNRCFGTIFCICSPRARQVKSQSFFAAFLPPLIRTQEGVKSPKIAKLHLNFTFYLSQSLPQSCNTKNYRRLSGASKCCKLRCFMNVPCILPAKKRDPPPPAKADCVSASGKTRPFAPTVRADFAPTVRADLYENSFVEAIRFLICNFSADLQNTKVKITIPAC